MGFLKEGTVVLFSGGLDSTVALYWAMRNLPHPCIGLIFDYGQRNLNEIQAARKIAEFEELELVEISIPVFHQFGKNAMLIEGAEFIEDRGDGIPNTFLPGRNLVFLSLAASLAAARGYHNLVMGTHDYSKYPDCRSENLRGLEASVRLGINEDLRFHFPFASHDRAYEIRLARTIPGCWEALALSMTCYNGVVPACGICPSCVSRAKGFKESGFEDPALSLKGEEECTE